MSHYDRKFNKGCAIEGVGVDGWFEVHVSVRVVVPVHTSVKMSHFVSTGAAAGFFADVLPFCGYALSLRLLQCPLFHKLVRSMLL